MSHDPIKVKHSCFFYSYSAAIFVSFYNAKPMLVVVFIFMLLDPIETHTYYTADKLKSSGSLIIHGMILGFEFLFRSV